MTILTGSFPPTNIVGALRPFRLVKHLGRKGWKVIVLTHPPRPGQALDQTLLGELAETDEIRFVSKQNLGGNKSSELSRRASGAFRDLIGRWVKPDLDLLHVSAFYREFAAVNQQHKTSVFMTTSPAHSIHLAGLLIKSRFGIPWVVDFRDPWDDFLKTGSADLGNPLERFLETRVIRMSDAVVSTTSTYTTILCNRHPGVPCDKFFTVTNSFDCKKTFKVQEKSKEKFIICYTGIFYPSKDPYGFFRALRKWFDGMNHDDCSRYRDRLLIHLIGSGDGPTRKAIEELQLEKHVVFFDRMPHDKAIEKTLQADMALISTGLGEQTRPGWLPSKLFEYLGCRIPILALIREGEMAEIIRKTNSGYVVTAENHSAIGEVIKAHIDHKFSDFGCDSMIRLQFNDIDIFEEEKVMKDFFSIIARISR